VRIALREALQRDADWADLAEDTAGGPPAQPWPAPMVRRLDGPPTLRPPAAPSPRRPGWTSDWSLSSMIPIDMTVDTCR
jgi:hypothetical protein